MTITATNLDSAPAPAASTALAARTVLLLSPTGEMGGAERVLLALARNLRAFGYDPIVGLLRPGTLAEQARAEGLTVHVFPEPYRYRDIGVVLRCIRWTTELIRENKVALVHSNLTAHLIGSPAARRAGVPEVWHLYDPIESWDVVDQLNRRLKPRFVIFMTETVARSYSALRHLPHQVVLPTCVEVGALRAAPGNAQVRQDLGLGNAPFFLTVTRLQEHKGHAYLIEAAAQASKTLPSALWVIVGQPSGAEQEAYAAQIKQQVAECGLTNAVRFVGAVSDADLNHLYREATALVHPATSEGFGLILIEAMALGCPVIAAASDGPSMIVQDGENGLLVPTRNSDALALAMQEVAEDAPLRERLQRGGTAYADAHSVQDMTGQVAAIYDGLLSR